MSGLYDFWPYARNWWGVTAASVTFLAAVYYGPKKMLETWEWYRDRWFDAKVRDVLHDNRQREAVRLNDGRQANWAYPVSVAKISELTGVSVGRVIVRLNRLHRKGDAVPLLDGTWKATDLIR
jgi:hypothetical protein